MINLLTTKMFISPDVAGSLPYCSAPVGRR